ncbi:unnamed protein product, partial [Didymodactylos carnosus]
LDTGKTTAAQRQPAIHQHGQQQEEKKRQQEGQKQMALSLQNLLLSSLTPSTTSELQSFCELLPFTGEVGQNVVHWLMAFNEACSTAGIGEDQHRLWLRFKLLGGPKSWYRLKQKTLLSYNWKKVQMALIETFGTFSQIEQASEILRSQIASH